MASLDLEFGFRDLAPESFPEFNHARELDDLWFGIRCDVEFVAFRILVGVIVPTNRHAKINATDQGTLIF